MKPSLFLRRWLGVAFLLTFDLFAGFPLASATAPTIRPSPSTTLSAIQCCSDRRCAASPFARALVADERRREADGQHTGGSTSRQGKSAGPPAISQHQPTDSERVESSRVESSRVESSRVESR